MLSCPFCGAPETDRFDLDGGKFLVFGCMFTPRVDPSLSDEEIAGLFERDFKGRAPGYFQGMCDRLHLYVTKGDGARALLGGSKAESPDPP